VFEPALVGSLEALPAGLADVFSMIGWSVGLAHPQIGPRLTANSSRLAAPPSNKVPTRSKLTWAGRGVSGSTTIANTRATRVIGTWATNTHRQLNKSITGPPTTIPSTGPPAMTNDQ
jgi:hypothetical protein